MERELAEKMLDFSGMLIFSVLAFVAVRHAGASEFSSIAAASVVAYIIICIEQAKERIVNILDRPKPELK